MLGLNSADLKSKTLTHFTLVQIDTQFEYLVNPTEINGSETLSFSYVAKSHLKAGKPMRVAKLLLNVIQDPEVWLSACL